MSTDEWTPAKGWMILGAHLAVRGAIVAAVEAAILFGISLATAHLPAAAPGMAGTFVVLIVFGWPLGSLFVRGLVNRCGLAPNVIIGPAAVFLVAAAMGAFHAYGAFKAAGAYTYLIAFCMAGWSVIAAGKNILSE